MRLGILGGTFDPPHVGHLILAQDALGRVPLDRVLFVPAAQPPHKLDRDRTAASLRLEMVAAAIAADDRFETSDLELRREGPSYTVDTLEALRGTRPGAELFLLLGADQFRELPTWRDPAGVAGRARIVVLPREGMDTGAAIEAVRSALPDVDAVALEATRIDVSSTEIRRRRAAGEPIRYLVPDAVRAIVERENLYASATP